MSRVPRPPLFTPAFVLVTATHLMVALGTMMFVHLPGFLQELGAGELAIGNVMTMPAFVGMLLGSAIGHWLDRHGRRRGLLTGLALIALVCGLYTTVRSIGPWLYAVRLLDGFAGVLVYTALFATAADRVPSARRTEGIAIFGSAGLLAIGLAAEVGGWVIDLGGWNALFATASGLILVSLVLASRIGADAPRAAAAEARSVWGPLRQPDLRPIWATAFVFFVAMATVFTFMKTFALQLPFADVGAFFLTYSAVSVSLRLFAGWLPDRIGPARMLAPALGAYGSGILLLVDVQSAPVLILAGALCGVGHGYAFPILFSLAVTRAHPDSRGATTGIYTTIDFAGHFMAGPLLGAVIEGSGYASAFGGVAVALAITIAAFLVWDRRVASPVPTSTTALEPTA